MRRTVAIAALVVLSSTVVPRTASAHAGLRSSDPPSGAALDVAPKVLRLTFSEPPQSSLTAVRVLDARGVAYQTGLPHPRGDDPRVLEIALRELTPRVYTVGWRSVSGVDGHASTGSFAFGVGALPAPPPPAVGPAPLPAGEIIARWTFVAGIVALVGAAIAGAAGFGAASGGSLAVGGLVASVVGAALLAEALRRNASLPLSALWATPAGRGLVWRAACIAVAAGAIAAARASRGRAQRAAVVTCAVAGLAAVAVHVRSGHAGAAIAATAVQWVHVSSVAVWLGGLAALLGHVRGAPSEAKAAALRRFSMLAGVALALVVVTGLVRAIGELTGPADLVRTGYGRALLAKAGIAVVIAGLAARNRWRNVPRATATLTPLRRTAVGELGLAAGALAAAAAMASLAPPRATIAVEPGITASGADYARSVRATLRMQSPSAGPNRFTFDVVDYDTKRPVTPDRVWLRFVPLEDPGSGATALTLHAARSGSFTALGANLSLDGAWRVYALVERGASSVTVPLDVRTRGPVQDVSVSRGSPTAVSYVIELADGGGLSISPESERPGRTTLRIASSDGTFGEPRPVERAAVTVSAGGRAPHVYPVRPAGTGRFEADVTLVRGRNTITVVETIGGARLRASTDLVVRSG